MTHLLTCFLAYLLTAGLRGGEVAQDGLRLGVCRPQCGLHDLVRALEEAVAGWSKAAKSAAVEAARSGSRGSGWGAQWAGLCPGVPNHSEMSGAP